MAALINDKAPMAGASECFGVFFIGALLPYQKMPRPRSSVGDDAAGAVLQLLSQLAYVAVARLLASPHLSVPAPPSIAVLPLPGVRVSLPSPPYR